MVRGMHRGRPKLDEECREMLKKFLRDRLLRRNCNDLRHMYIKYMGIIIPIYIPRCEDCSNKYEGDDEEQPSQN